MHTSKVKRKITSYINKCLIYSDTYSVEDIQELEKTLKEICDDLEIYEAIKYYPEKENDRYLLEQYVFECVDDYLNHCPSDTVPDIFKFSLDLFIHISQEKWDKIIHSAEKTDWRFPSALLFALKEVQSTIRHYNYFESFSTIRQQEKDHKYVCLAEQVATDTATKRTTDIINKSLDKVQQMAQEAENRAVNAQTKATEATTQATEATTQATEAATQATEAATQANQAAVQANQAAVQANEAAKNAVNKEMVKVTRTVSETTVTVLGIFSAIVITVVAGLIFSSSVFENISSAGLSKVLLITSVVGFVCVNILVAMFYYIDRYRYAGEKEENDDDNRKIKEIIKDNIRIIIKKHFWICFINAILLILIVVSMILCIVNQVMFDNPIQGNNSCAGSSNNINVNIGESIIPSDSTTTDSFEIETELESIETENKKDDSTDESETSNIE